MTRRLTTQVVLTAHRTICRSDMLKPVSRFKGEHPQGEFSGKITHVSSGRSEHSGRYMSLKIKTSKGEINVSLFPESSNMSAKQIANRNVSTILKEYEDPPSGRFDYFLDIMPLLKDLPVMVYVSNKSDKMNVYFREVHKAVKVRRQDGRVVERVQY